MKWLTVSEIEHPSDLKFLHPSDSIRLATQPATQLDLFEIRLEIRLAQKQLIKSLEKAMGRP